MQPMKRAALGTACAAVIALAHAGLSPAEAAEGFYARADIGLSIPRDLDGNWLEPNDGGIGGDLKNGALAGAGIGYRFAFGLRTDAAVSYRPHFDLSSEAADRFGNAGTAKSDVSALTVMLNVYYDLPLEGRFTPFVGAGLGFARNRIGSVDYTLNGAFLDVESGHTETNFAWALMAGGSYAVTDRIALEVGYRYLDAGELKTSGSLAFGGSVPALTSDLRSHEVMASLRYSF